MKQIEKVDAEACCGMSRAFGFRDGNLSIPVLRQRMNNIEKAGAGVVACACSGCMAQLPRGIDQQTPDKKMRHMADIIA